MAKNKNRKHGRQARPSGDGQAAQQAHPTGSGMDADASGSPGGTGRKQQRRFGHN